MLFLNEKDIKQAISMKDAINAIDKAYDIYASNQFKMPTRTQVVDDKNTLLLMPCLTEESIATKLVTLFPENTTHPTLHGLIILNSSETGEIKAIMDGTFVTGFRTGAIGGSATRHLAHDDASKLAIIGTGVQGLYQAVSACTERPITDIYLYNRSPEKIRDFKNTLRRWIGHSIQLHDASTSEEAVKEAHIIITATTSSTPVLPDDPNLLKGKLTIGIGSFQPSMREFPEALYKISEHIFIDSDDVREESGDIKDPLEHDWINETDVETMSTYLTSPRRNVDKGKNIIFKSTGMALFDSVVANLIYQKAIEKKAGHTFNL
ncbi:Alanine dehydrogenase [Lentibacillus sp. JNUCC-1]|uniref:ornithine cyclodeaminase family protein n=1 Tax=Lentibacillus sp. JNUCC-1 TaxID=2654513 RepID=UPI00132C9B6C|nr:ornithine cyclodeaminase family protein [Lentibacillus sp. JNUCC-1]MUV37030.1 Alanine dehydrogenase [Lentibacillus sp. JNUCC-1]